MRLRLLFALLMSGNSISAGLGEEADPAVARGERLAKELCASCHAVGSAGRGPRPSAPAFRVFDERLDLDGFTERLRAGLTSDHPDMPAFRFTRQDARALVAYLRTLQAR